MSQVLLHSIQRGFSFILSVCLSVCLCLSFSFLSHKHFPLPIVLPHCFCPAMTAFFLSALPLSVSLSVCLSLPFSHSPPLSLSLPVPLTDNHTFSMIVFSSPFPRFSLTLSSLYLIFHFPFFISLYLSSGSKRKINAECQDG